MNETMQQKEQDVERLLTSLFREWCYEQNKDRVQKLVKLYNSLARANHRSDRIN